MKNKTIDKNPFEDPINVKADIERYTSLWISKQITDDEFKSLISGIICLVGITDLTESGLDEVK